MKDTHKILLCCFFLVIPLSCGNTTFVSSVPSYPVHFEINILAEYPNFVPSGTIETLTFTERRYPTDAIGYAGLLVFTAFDEHYHACDLCCPKCVKRDMPLEVDGMYACCPNCGEAYDLSYGYCNPTKNIAKEMLRMYNASYSNGKLLIYQK